jgi:hypothetical protein
VATTKALTGVTACSGGDNGRRLRICVSRPGPTRRLVRPPPNAPDLRLPFLDRSVLALVAEPHGISNLLGYGLGPLSVGILADAIGGPNSLRYALAVVSTTCCLVSAACFVLARVAIA